MRNTSFYLSSKVVRGENEKQTSKQKKETDFPGGRKEKESLINAVVFIILKSGKLNEK